MSDADRGNTESRMRERSFSESALFPLNRFDRCGLDSPKCLETCRIPLSYWRDRSQSSDSSASHRRVRLLCFCGVRSEHFEGKCVAGSFWPKSSDRELRGMSARRNGRRVFALSSGGADVERISVSRLWSLIGTHSEPTSRGPRCDRGGALRCSRLIRVKRRDGRSSEGICEGTRTLVDEKATGLDCPCLFSA